MVASDTDRQHRWTISWKLHGSVALLGIFLVAIMNFGYYIGHNMVNQDRLLVAEVLQIELEVTMGHLRLEETLRRELGADNLQARQHFQAAKKSITELLEGCEPANTILLASVGPECREIAAELQQDREGLERLGNQRYLGFVDGVVDTELDEQYHTVYTVVIAKTRQLEQILQTELNRHLRLFYVVQIFVTCSSLLLLVAILFIIRRFELRRGRDLQIITNANNKLSRALEEVGNLQGIIPICGHCKKIRDEQGSWKQLEAYIKAHSDAEFSHGICPDCYEREIQKIRGTAVVLPNGRN